MTFTSAPNEIDIVSFFFIDIMTFDAKETEIKYVFNHYNDGLHTGFFVAVLSCDSINRGNILTAVLFSKESPIMISQLCETMGPVYGCSSSECIVKFNYPLSVFHPIHSS